MDTAETAAFRNGPQCGAGPAVSLLSCVIDLRVGRALCQVFAVMTQPILGNLDGIEVALRAPLGGQRHTWEERRGLNIIKNKQTHTMTLFHVRM